MSDQGNDNDLKPFLENSLKYLRSRAKKNQPSFDLNSSDFEKNLEEIIKNPKSKYADKIYLFNEIPNLEEKQKNLNSSINNLEGQIANLNKQIDGDESANNEREKQGLLEYKNNLQIQIDGDESAKDEREKQGLLEYKNNLQIQIDGDESATDERGRQGLLKYKNNLEGQIANLNKQIDGDESATDEREKQGLLEYKNNLNKQIYVGDEFATDEKEKQGLLKYKDNLEKKIDELKLQHKTMHDDIKKLTQNYQIVENLTDLKKEAIGNKKWYNWYVAGMIVIVILAFGLAYLYGKQIIDDIKKIEDISSRDYFGMFLMKMPFSLMIITFISGAFIFISKLLFIIERINNQLRNISQISVIASRIDQRTINLINENNPEDEQTKKEEKDLFYRLITDYLINLSKNELELKEKRNNQLKTLKELASIFQKINPNSKTIDQK